MLSQLSYDDLITITHGDKAVYKDHLSWIDASCCLMQNRCEIDDHPCKTDEPSPFLQVVASSCKSFVNPSKFIVNQ